MGDRVSQKTFTTLNGNKEESLKEVLDDLTGIKCQFSVQDCKLCNSFECLITNYNLIFEANNQIIKTSMQTFYKKVTIIKLTCINTKKFIG